MIGFGNLVYKNQDPRVSIIKQLSEQIFAVTGREDLIDVAMELERLTLNDDYFISRKLYPNIDFYSGVIYKAIGFPTEFFTVLFALPRFTGWLSHWTLLDSLALGPVLFFLGVGFFFIQIRKTINRTGAYTYINQS